MARVKSCLNGNSPEIEKYFPELGICIEMLVDEVLRK